ncbi:hypothetical protein HELRODRAFT_123271, partial [Helobdella robusta]|uniref:Protein-L-isoaspartate O-methyltransferase n=1 Tax=Helobdella robusta TaxID=6412 RepID=T1EGX4_HELRO
MGGMVSAGANNDELVRNLVKADIIKSPDVETVFRAVDRGHYFLPSSRSNAYKDSAWKSDFLHLSAPCIYGEVMEALGLEKGMSFLNLGSGTGYLSTMAGLILGSNGVNHGIEISEKAVEYSIAKVEEYINTNPYFDAFDFCHPIFKCGNCLSLVPGEMRYDRVYCGAACTFENENLLKNLVKVSGSIVVPIEDQLMKITRYSEKEWKANQLMAVSFADLI